MSVSVCIVPTNTLWYPQAGGHLWVYLNWALGLRALGCKVIWMEVVNSDTSPDKLQAAIVKPKTRLEPYGLADRVALFSTPANHCLAA